MDGVVAADGEGALGEGVAAGAAADDEGASGERVAAGVAGSKVAAPVMFSSSLSGSEDAPSAACIGGRKDGLDKSERERSKAVGGSKGCAEVAEGSA